MLHSLSVKPRAGHMLNICDYYTYTQIAMEFV